MFRMRGDGRPWDAPTSDSESSSDEAPSQHFDHHATRRINDTLPSEDYGGYYRPRVMTGDDLQADLHELQAENAVLRQKNDDLMTELVAMGGKGGNSAEVQDALMSRVSELEAQVDKLMVENRRLQLAEENRSALQRRLDDVREENAETKKQHRQDLLHLAEEFKGRYEALADERDKEYLQLQEKYNKTVEELKRVRLRSTKSTKMQPEYKQLNERYMKLSAEHQKLKEEGVRRPRDAHARVDTGRPGSRRNSVQGRTATGQQKRAPPQKINEVKVLVKEATEFVLEGVREATVAFVTLQMAGQKKNTSQRYNTFNPIWNENFAFPDTDLKRSLELTLTHKYGDGKVEHSSTTMELPKDGGKLDVLVPLNNTQGRSSGRVHLVMDVPDVPPVITPTADGHRIASGYSSSGDTEQSERAWRARHARTPPLEALSTARNGQKFWVCLLVRDGTFFLDTDKPGGDYSNTLSEESARAVYGCWNGKFQSAMRKKELSKAQSEYQEEINDMKTLYMSNIGGKELLKRKENEINQLRVQAAELETERDNIAEKLRRTVGTTEDKTHQISELQEKLSRERAAHHKADERNARDKKLLDASEMELKKTRRELLGFKAWKDKAEGLIGKLEGERDLERKDREMYEKEHDRITAQLNAERSRMGKLELQVLQEDDERQRMYRRGEDEGVVFNIKEKEEEARKLQQLAELTIENKTLRKDVDGLSAKLRREEDERARLSQELENLERTMRENKRNKK